jgi:glutamine---fructose-6-phosphate transaminase (isomerizing)
MYVVPVASESMCGIIAVIQRPARRSPPSSAELLTHATDAAAAIASSTTESVELAAGILEKLDAALRGASGVRALIADPDIAVHLRAELDEIDAAASQMELDADEGSLAVAVDQLEAFNAALVRVKDASWAVRRDRLAAAVEVAALAGEGAGRAAVEASHAINVALAAVDRLEVRGRDSAGLHVLVDGHALDLADDDVRTSIAARASDPLFESKSVRVVDDRVGFVYKAAAEIGELGDNVRMLRAAITSDDLLRRALASDDARITVLGHTRWASVGVISEANAHPLSSEEVGRDGPYVLAALNGDVDNYIELRERESLRIPADITTDAKVIPMLVSRRIAEGDDAGEAFRRTVSSFDGSVAIAANAASSPGTLLLGLRGSGQSLYIGLAEDAFLVASEPYGLVAETARYVRMDGETPSTASGQPGQIVVLDSDHAGELAGIRRLAYDGTEIPVDEADVVTASITTRDVDRGDFAHYLLKELFEAPGSLRKTLRGKLVSRDGRFTVALGDQVIPPELRQRLGSGEIRRIVVIGQGTAAVAGQAVAAAIDPALQSASIRVEAMLATELSGFRLHDDMTDTLVVAISQSGTTTDTNRTVDLVRARGALVIAIVNRRNSDLVERCDGVLYTSDGRDVEMSVASTKAFYAQVAAGFLLAAGLGDVVGSLDRSEWSELLEGLHDLPVAMEALLTRRDSISVAASYAPARRYWAIVGNGQNRIAASEIRIKLSELCYKSIACDSTEDKKHIDLSSEPLLLVCAAGLTGSNADDVTKEIGIYRAHKAAPIVIATDGEDRFNSALAVIAVPPTHPALAFVLSTMAGHLFGYEAALAIDAQARQLREMRAAAERVSPRPVHDLLDRLAGELSAPARRFIDGLRSGAYDGHLEASTAMRIVSVLRYARRQVLLESYELDFGVIGTPRVVVDDLIHALTKGIDELTRPVDAIKHQAKTVTVGTSRAEDDLMLVPLVQAVLAAGSPRDRLSYRSLRTLASLDPAVAEVVGYTRYAIVGHVASGRGVIEVVDKGGVAAARSSRADSGVPLFGTKNRVARQRLVTAAVGGDGAELVHVPETKGSEITGLTLLHVRFHDRLDAAAAGALLDGYQNRLAALRDAVTELEPGFDASVLGSVDVVDLLTEPVHSLATHWHHG